MVSFQGQRQLMLLYFNHSLTTFFFMFIRSFRSVTDPRNGKRVALKKMPNVFQSLTSSKRAYRELKMLCFFKHNNVSSRFFPCFVVKLPLEFIVSRSSRSSLEASFFRFPVGVHKWISPSTKISLPSFQVLSALDIVHPGHVDFFQEMYPLFKENLQDVWVEL